MRHPSVLMLLLGALAVAGCAPPRPHALPAGAAGPTLRYVTVGDGPALVVVLHGGPGVTHEYLRPEWDRLSALGEVVYYDQRGCGANPASGPLTWRDHVADLDRLIRARRRGRKVFLAGSSWGSELALRYAYVHPEAVDALVLSGFVGWPDSAAIVLLVRTIGRGMMGRSFDFLGLRPAERRRGGRGTDSLASSIRLDTALLRPPGSDALVARASTTAVTPSILAGALPLDSAAYQVALEAAVRRTVPSDSAIVVRRRADPSRGLARRYALDPAGLGGDSALAWRFPMFCNESGLRTGLSRLGPPLAALAAIQVPVLAVSGGAGTMPDHAPQLVGVLPGLVVRPVPGGGHDPWHTRPDAFFGLVISFLRNQLASQGTR